MARSRGTRTDGRSFDSETVDTVWKKGKEIVGQNSSTYRKDTCGAWMKKSEHGNTSSTYGWEIDHIKPVAQDGTDDNSNLQPLQWENNKGKSDNYPDWSCTKKS